MHPTPNTAKIYALFCKCEVVLPLLNYQQTGTGPDVLLIHGLFGSLENLNMVARVLADNYRVTQVDVRNHGRSFHKNNMQYSELAQDVVELLLHLAIPQSHILGHSMGGKIAMELALTAPQFVNKLIIADIAPVKYPRHHQEIIAGLKAIDLSKVSNRNDADKQLSAYVNDPGVRQFLLRNLTKQDGKFVFKCNLAAIENCYEQIMQTYEGNNQFVKPTLFVKGANSDYIKAAYRDSILERFPKSKAKIIQGAGHWLHAEKTTAFNKIVNDFLADS